ncbi:hypothetical protein MPD5_0726 [Melissococcus plutonius DAT561]|nr:hypothetical protein MPD5_0726 [Melissococcus plutonius DAT561]
MRSSLNTVLIPWQANLNEEMKLLFFITFLSFESIIIQYLSL